MVSVAFVTDVCVPYFCRGSDYPLSLFERLLSPLPPPQFDLGLGWGGFGLLSFVCKRWIRRHVAADDQ